MELSEHVIFYNCVYSTVQTNIDNSKIEREILNIQKTESGRKLSNIGGWQSNDLIDFSSTPEIFKMIDSIQTVLSEIYSHWKIPKKPTFDNAWINVNYQYCSNNFHRHPKSLFACVYYVKAPKDCGEIVFRRDDTQEHYFDIEYSEHTMKSFSIFPVPGLTVFFPAYIMHMVKPNLSNDPRISIAVNFC
jgi:uncharacterized protein (TIGR02466 family)